MSFHLNVKLDTRLAVALKAFAAEAELTLSQATRDLLRVALRTEKAARDRGWQEGRAEGYAEVLSRAAGAQRPKKAR